MKCYGSFKNYGTWIVCYEMMFGMTVTKEYRTTYQRCLEIIDIELQANTGFEKGYIIEFHE